MKRKGGTKEMRTEFIAERKRELKLTNQMISDSTGIALSTLDKITCADRLFTTYTKQKKLEK